MKQLLDSIHLADYQDLYVYKLHEMLDKGKFKNQKSLEMYQQQIKL
jgi:hypothetical protein